MDNKFGYNYENFYELRSVTTKLNMAIFVYQFFKKKQSIKLSLVYMVTRRKQHVL